ncbi:hypothetical protein Tco_1361770 [Tanacetum coccineum]
MNKKSYSFDMETFRNMLLICLKLPGQKFIDPPFEEEILTFIRELGYPGNIKLLSDVKVDTLPQPWRSFGTIINNGLSGKVTGIDTLRLSRAQILWGLYGAILPDYLTNPTMKESKAYKTYYDLATRKVQPKPKYVRRSSRTKTDEAPKPSSGKRVKAIAKVAKSRKKKQPAHGLEALSDIAMTEAEQMKLAIKRSKIQLHISQPSSFGAHKGIGVTPGVPNFSTHDDEAMQDEEVNEEDSFDPRVHTPSHVESTDDEDDDDEEVQEGRDVEMTDDQPTNVQTTQVTEDTHVIITLVILEGQQQSSSVSSGFISNMLNPRPDIDIDSIFNTKATSLVDVPVTTIAEPPLVFATTLPPPPTPLITQMQQTPFPIPTRDPSTSLQDLPNFAVSSIPGIVDAYLANKMNEAVKTVVQLQSDRLKDEAQAENKDFLNKLDDNIKKIIKDQVKEQVKAQVSKILPKIEKTVNEQLEAEVMTRSSTESKTSFAIAANLSELELKKILIEKMESNKSINRSNEQKNLYKALVEAYKSDKLILDTYGDTVSFKRRRDDEDKDEEPSAGSNRGSKRRRAGKEPESTSAPKEKRSKTTGKSTNGSKSQHKSAGESAHTEEPMHTDKNLEEPAHQEIDIGATEEQPDFETYPLPDWFQQENLCESFDELTDTPFDFSAFVMNRLNVETLTPELLAGLTFELMKGTCKSLVELEYFFEEIYKATTEQLDWYNPEGQQYTHDLRKPLPLIPNSHDRQVIPFDHFINNNLAYLCGGVSSQTYATSVIKTKLHTFKESDFKRLRLQVIEDMLLLLVQGKLTNLNVEERVKSYQKKLNITKLDSYRSDLKRREAYSAYSNPRGFIFQNRDKKNKLIRVDELYKFSDETLNDVRIVLDGRLKGIRMEYLPQTIWRQRDRERAKAMIQAIDK